MNDDKTTNTNDNDQDELNQQANDPQNNSTGSTTQSNDEPKSLELQLEEEKNKKLQIMADFENYKKRIESEKATFGAITNMGLIQEILEIHDDLQMALSDEQLDLDRAKTSIKTAQDKLLGAANSAGIERVEIKVGDEFNRETMEAITTVPDGKNKNKVIAVISSAYKYSNRDGILKSAKVIVGK